MTLNYSVNELLAKVNSSEQVNDELIKEISKATDKILPIPPFAYVENFNNAAKKLKQTPCWISYGGSRTGSTYITFLLEALMSAVSSSYLKSWEGDFESVSNFFNIIKNSDCIKTGILKIHRVENSCKASIYSGEAKAIVSTRDYPSIAKSWARVFFTQQSRPSDDELIKFVEEEIETEKKKREMPNTLFIKCEDIEGNSKELIARVCSFLGITLHHASIDHIACKLSKQSIIKLQSHLTLSKVGHDSRNFLHKDHVSRVPYEDLHVENLIREKFHERLGKDGYLRDA